MRTTILIVFAVLILVCVPAMAAGDHVELYNIGVTVSMEEEQTTISLFLDGMIEPMKIDTEEESILIFDLPDVELTAADEGGTSFMVFSPSVASIKLTQLETDPFVTRLEIYTNDLREFAIETVGTGIDFIIFPVGGSPVLSETAEVEETETPVEEPVEEEVVIEEPVEEEVVEKPVIVEEPPASENPLGYRPIPREEWIAGETEEAVEEEPVIEEPIEEEPVEEEPEVEEEIVILEEIVIPYIEEEPEEVNGGFNLLEGINLLVTEEEEAPEEPVVEVVPVEEPPAEESMIEELAEPVEEVEEGPATVEAPAFVPTAGSVMLDNLNFQASEAGTDLLVFSMVDDYPGEVRTNFVYLKGFIVLSHCDVSSFVRPGDYKTVELSGKHLRYIVININDAGEAVFSLILTDPEAQYSMNAVIDGNLVKVSLKSAE